MVLNFPFLERFISASVKKHDVSDSADYLNYYVTSLMLAFFSLAISAKQYFGSPIQCWVPNEFKGGWEQYTEDYCFIANSYSLAMHEDLPSADERYDRISYYRWVPITLAIQSIMFFFPNWIWTKLISNSCINPEHFLKEANRADEITSPVDKQVEIKSIARHFLDTINTFTGGRRYGSITYRLSSASGNNLMYGYLMMKLIYVVNIVMQMVLLNKFLGEDYMYWGFDVMHKFVQGKEWEGEHIFPRVILCDFEVRKMGSIHRYTVQCVIMMNMINEKLYLLLYVWLLVLAVLTMTSLLYYIVMLLVPQLRARMVLANPHDDNSDSQSLCARRSLLRFVSRGMDLDGILLLSFVKTHVGARMSTALAEQIHRYYIDDCKKGQPQMTPNGKMNLDDSLEKHSLMGNKYTHPPSYANNPSFYPNVDSTAPMLEDYMDQGTMRVGEKPGVVEIDENRSSPTDV